MDLDAKTENAAQLIVAGELSLTAIAESVGVTDRTLRNWRSDAAFSRRVDEIREEYRDRVRARGIAVREHRIAAANRRHALLEQMRAERADDPNLVRLPGGSTGLVVITDWKKIGGGPEEEPTIVPVHGLDASMLKEFRELEKQVAMDTGQWTEKRELSGPGGTALPAMIEASIVKIYGRDESAEPPEKTE